MRCAQAVGTTTHTCEGNRPGNQIASCRAVAVNPENGVVICHASYSRTGARIVRAAYSGERDLDDRHRSARAWRPTTNVAVTPTVVLTVNRQQTIIANRSITP